MVQPERKRGGGLLRPKPVRRVVAVSEVPAVEGNPTIQEDDELLTDEEVMKMLKVNKQWLADHRTRVRPIIPHIPFGKTIRYSKRAISAWLQGLTERRPVWERESGAA